jgi:signal peptidase I
VSEQAQSATQSSVATAQPVAPKVRFWQRRRRVTYRVDLVHSHDGIFTVVRNILETVVVIIFIVTFVVQPSQIPSDSMVPALQVGDFLLVNKQAFVPSDALDHLLLPSFTVQRGDIIVFHYPVDGSVTLVKRVIGVPGDHLRLHAGKVFVNGEALSEPYAYYAPSRANNYRDEFPSLREFPDDNVQTSWWLALRNLPRGGDLVVPPKKYFVLGDNRNDSEDSRYWGFVPQDEIIGRPLLVYFSATREAEARETGAMNHLRAEKHSIHVPR